MQKFGEIVVKYRKIILIIAILLLIPSVIAYKATRVNYDILLYLPETVKTVQGENILSEAYSIVLLDNMKTKDILSLEEKIKNQIDGVEICASIADLTGEGFPIEMLPDDLTDKVYKDGTTLMIVTFEGKISADETMKEVEQLRSICDEHCKISRNDSNTYRYKKFIRIRNSNIRNYCSNFMFDSPTSSNGFMDSTSIAFIKYRICNLV